MRRLPATMDRAGRSFQGGVAIDALELESQARLGNPNPGNIGSDFNRFGLDFWDAVDRLDARNRTGVIELQELNVMRNAIAHHDPKILAVRRLHLRQVSEWRRVCENLAHCFDEVMRAHLESMTGSLALVSLERRTRDEIQEWQAEPPSSASAIASSSSSGGRRPGEPSRRIGESSATMVPAGTRSACRWTRMIRRLHVMGEDELEPDSISRVPLEKSEIIDYLKRSGLFSILLPTTISHSSIPWSGSAAVITGDITYTFAPRRGLIGGQIDPRLGPSTRPPDRRPEEGRGRRVSPGLRPDPGRGRGRDPGLGVSPVKKPRRRKAETA